MLQSYIDAWVEELERVVSAYQAAVDEVEQALDRVEQTSASADPGEQLRHDQYLRELDIALESAQQVAEEEWTDPLDDQSTPQAQPWKLD